MVAAERCGVLCADLLELSECLGTFTKDEQVVADRRERVCAERYHSPQRQLATQ